MFSTQNLSFSRTPENIAIFLENDFWENVFQRWPIFRETNAALDSEIDYVRVLN